MSNLSPKTVKTYIVKTDIEYLTETLNHYH